MQFERLRNSHKKEIVIGAIVICIVSSALTFATTKAKYKLTQSIDLVKGTINYKPYDFKIMAMYKSEDGTNYTEINDRMPSIGYIINESKSYCTLNNKTHDTEVVLKTINGHHIIENLKKSDKCYLYFDKKASIDNAKELLAKVQSESKTTTPDFGQIATTDEGVYRASDGMYEGTSYYWRGAVTNNYVRFAGFCWRIIRINGDGSIRLIYDGTTCHANGEKTTDSIAVSNQVYNSDKDRSESVGWTYVVGSQRPSSTSAGTSNNVKSQTENWLNINITGANILKTASGKFCNDRNVKSGSIWSSQPTRLLDYAGWERLFTTKSPTLSCSSEDTYISYVGLITVDEGMYAGGAYGKENSSYYLYNGQDYWTMSPCSVSWNGSDRFTDMFQVTSHSSLSSHNVHTPLGIRPVINLKADTTFQSGGTGTQSNPYVVN